MPGFGDDYALDILPEYLNIMLFSSDYPHQEGNPDPINLYSPALWELDASSESGSWDETQRMSLPEWVSLSKRRLRHLATNSFAEDSGVGEIEHHTQVG